ncbi:hypothetical protein HQ496_07215 [bacterium]|nr:hypothetical protein [bacterium]
MNNRIHIGIDAGGSKIETVCNSNGKSISCSFPSVNARVAPESETIERICTSIETVLSSLFEQDNDAQGQPVVVCLGIAGAASSQIQGSLRSGISRVSGIPSSNISVVSDARIGFEAAFLDDSTSESSTSASSRDGRMLVICGTGSGCYSFDTDGQILRTGGWGPTIGDPGSGLELGKRLLRHAIADIEAGEETPFTRAIQSVFEQEMNEGALTVPSILDKVYRTEFNAASLAPALLQLAIANKIARAHLENECAGLVTQICRLAGVLKTKNPTVRLTGGLNANSLYSDVLTLDIKSKLPQARVSVAKHKPVQGALHLAQLID